LVANLLDEEQDETLWKTILSSLSHEWKLLADEPEDPELN
jgi:hypothetical protein